MSVAENNPMPSVASQSPQQQVAIRSFIGAVVILAGLGLVLGAIPHYWWLGWESAFAANENLKNNVFLSEALLILVELCVIGGLVYAAYHASQKLTEPGVRSGIVLMALVIFAALNLCALIGGSLENQFAESPAVGWIVLAALFAAVVGGVGYLVWASPVVFNLLIALQDQNWFHLNSYKGSQGVRVRRGTIAGIIAVLGCGIITMNFRGFFGSNTTMSAVCPAMRSPATGLKS